MLRSSHKPQPGAADSQHQHYSQQQHSTHTDSQQQHSTHTDSQQQQHSTHTDSQQQQHSTHTDSQQQQHSTHTDSQQQQHSTHTDSQQQQHSTHTDSQHQHNQLQHEQTPVGEKKKSYKGKITRLRQEREELELTLEIESAKKALKKIQASEQEETSNQSNKKQRPNKRLITKDPISPAEVLQADTHDAAAAAESVREPTKIEPKQWGPLSEGEVIKDSVASTGQTVDDRLQQQQTADNTDQHEDNEAISPAEVLQADTHDAAAAAESEGTNKIEPNSGGYQKRGDQG